jgi:hypothetical protein
VAFEWTGSLPQPTRFAAEGGKTMPAQNMPANNIEVQVRKPQAKTGHADH